MPYHLALDIYLYSYLVLLYHKHVIHVYNHILFFLMMALDIFTSLYLCLPYYWHLIHIYNHVFVCLIIWHLIYIYIHILFCLIIGTWYIFIIISCFASSFGTGYTLYSYLVLPYNWHLIFLIIISCFALSLAIHNFLLSTIDHHTQFRTIIFMNCIIFYSFDIISMVKGNSTGNVNMML